MKKIPTLWWITGFIVLIVGLFGWSRIMQSNDPNVISPDGVHWHPQLTIYIDGQKQDIPANVGLGAVHQPMHTHAEDVERGVLHLEFGSAVRTDNVRISEFFKVWGKDMMKDFGVLTKMMVNGEANTDYENHILQDGENVELFYESNTSEEGGSTTSLGVPAPGVDPETVEEMIVNDGGDVSKEE